MPCGCAPKGGPQFDPDCEGPSPEDIERFGGDTIACPGCGADVYDEAPFCHRCGRAFGDDAPSGPAMGPVIIGVVALLIVAFVLWGVVL
jgi:hypothetical protein